MGRDLAELLEEYHRRRAMGESVSAADYRELAGDDFAEFEEVLEAEAAIDEAMGDPEVTLFPMPFGEYTLLSELGRGAEGVVYEAVHRDLGRKAALKILQSGFDTHPTAIERFRREARACAQVRHDNIVEIYEAGQVDDRHFYAMALIEGRPLSRVARAAQLPEPRALAGAIADIADALHELHERGVIHRDIKPSNIMVEPSGRMVLADFGLARTVAAESLTQTGQSLGTPKYMSPEQLMGKSSEINARTDVYGLGATLYELIAGQPVFNTRDLTALMRMILSERPEPLRDVAPQTPRGLGRIVMKALEKKNADRYETAAAMRDDLLAFSQGKEVTGKPLPPIRHALRALRRTAWWSAPAAAVVLLGALYLAMRPAAPATLTLRCVPVARVELNGEDRGTTPLEIEIPPGEYELVLTCDGWQERHESLRLEAGEKSSMELLLKPKDPSDPAALDQLASALKLTLSNWEPLAKSRGAAPERSINLLLPRGRVRAQDAKTFRFTIDEKFNQPGSIVFKAKGRVLYTRKVDDEWPVKLDTREQLKKLEAGTEVTWGFYPDKGEPVTTTFTVAPPSEKVAEIEEKLKDFDPVVRDLFVAQHYLDTGLHMAAYTKARGVAQKLAHAPKAYAIMKTALTKMGLQSSPLWVELVQLSSKKR